MKYALIVATALAAVSTPAMAQDAANPFSGVRVEALTGYDSIGVSIDEEVFGAELEDRSSGVLYGVAVGYDFDLGSVVAGVEAELSESTTGSSVTFDDESIEGYIVDGTASLDASRDLYLGIRAGNRLGDRTLLYWKGGYSMARADFNATGTIDGDAGTIDVVGKFDGWRLGAGLETLVGRNAFAKIEYRYSNYGGGEVNLDGTDIDIDEAFESFDLDRHQVAVGFGLRF